jgi:hypothetical protein
MIRFSALAAAVLVFSATGSALAQDKNIKLGLRLGYALPSGSIGSATVDGETLTGGKMSDAFSGQVPIWIDAGYMVTPSLLVGLYGQYGFVSTKNCDPGASCSAHDFRIGVQGQYHIMPAELVDPWLGVGFGYEDLSGSQSQGGSSVDIGLSGWELLNLQGGIDFKATDALTVGPFLSYSLDQYNSISSGGTSIDLTSKSLHEWITFGVKGTYGI